MKQLNPQQGADIILNDILSDKDNIDTVLAKGFFPIEEDISSDYHKGIDIIKKVYAKGNIKEFSARSVKFIDSICNDLGFKLVKNSQEHYKDLISMIKYIGEGVKGYYENFLGTDKKEK